MSADSLIMKSVTYPPWSLKQEDCSSNIRHPCPQPHHRLWHYICHLCIHAPSWLVVNVAQWKQSHVPAVEEFVSSCEQSFLQLNILIAWQLAAVLHQFNFCYSLLLLCCCGKTKFPLKQFSLIEPIAAQHVITTGPETHIICMSLVFSVKPPAWH